MIAKAVEAAGGVVEAAAKLGVTYQTVQKWIKRNQLPAERVIALEQACAAHVTRYQLRPDIYPTPAVAA